MDNRPLVSVVVPCYNKERYVERTLSSLCAQKYSNFEVKIVDDCSTDRTWEIVQGFVAKDSRFAAERNAVNKGGDYCRNRGAALSKGKYLIFLDADDWLAEDCLAVRVAEMEKDAAGEWDMIVFPSISSKGGRLYNYMALREGADPVLGFLRMDSPWQTMMPIWRRTSFERFGGFDEAFPRLQDVEIFSRVLIGGAKVKASERTTYDCYYCDEDARMMDFDKLARKSVAGMLMFLNKMSGLVKTKTQSAALAETELSAIRTVGDIYQMGGIDAGLRDELYANILSRPNASGWSWLYARCYRLKTNKLRGFNWLFIRIYRFFMY